MSTHSSSAPWAAGWRGEREEMMYGGEASGGGGGAASGRWRRWNGSGRTRRSPPEGPLHPHGHGSWRSARSWLRLGTNQQRRRPRGLYTSLDGSSRSGSSDNLVFQAPLTIREDYIQNVVKFLAHPKVKGSRVSNMYSFLEKKVPTKGEIDESLRWVPISSFFGYLYIVQKLLRENDRSIVQT